MASSIVTADGKDLDSRYLGINAKAKSATTADTAGSANYANSAGSSSISVVTLSVTTWKENNPSTGLSNTVAGFRAPNSDNSWLLIVSAYKNGVADITSVKVCSKNETLALVYGAKWDENFSDFTGVAIKLS